MIRVLVVDDSISMRSVLARIIDQCDGMHCIGTAENAETARAMIRELNPDVVTLDVEMPGMNGLEFLERIMRLRPTATIMISTQTTAGSETALRALELGAVDVIAKPMAHTPQAMADYAHDIGELIRVAAKAKLASPAAPALRALARGPAKAKAEGTLASRVGKLIAIGSSTGGTEALKVVLQQMPPSSPPILMAQHMPVGFTASFAARLDSLSQIHVKEAEHGELLRNGCAYLAPGHSHLVLGVSGGHYMCQLSDEPPVNRHRPSVDVLFNSVAQLAGRHATGVMLTGMGKDGAAGMLKMFEAGAHNIAQDEKSCVVFGMPKEAIARGGVHEVMDLNNIAGRLIEKTRQR